MVIRLGMHDQSEWCWVLIPSGASRFLFRGVQRAREVEGSLFELPVLTRRCPSLCRKSWRSARLACSRLSSFAQAARAFAFARVSASTERPPGYSRTNRRARHADSAGLFRVGGRSALTVCSQECADPFRPAASESFSSRPRRLAES